MPTAYNGRQLPLSANTSGKPTWAANLALGYDFTGVDSTATDGVPWKYTGGTKPTLTKSGTITYPTHAGEPGAMTSVGSVYSYTNAADFGLQVGTGDFTLGVRFSTAATLPGSTKSALIRLGNASTDQCNIGINETTAGWYVSATGGSGVTLGTASAGYSFGVNRTVIAWLRRVAGVTTVWTQDVTASGGLVSRYAAGAANSGALDSTTATRLQYWSSTGLTGANVQGITFWREGLSDATMQAIGQDWYAQNTNGVAASTIAITSPASGASIPATATISGTYTSTAPTSVEVQHGAGTWVAGTGLTASGGNWSASFVLPVNSAAALRARYGNDTSVVSADVANVTVIAKSISFVYPAAGSPTPSDVCPYRIFQRRFDGGSVSVQVSGTYSGGTPASIQWRWNGGSWGTLVASPSGGAFSVAVTLPGTGMGDLEIRWSDDTTVSAACSSVGVGDVYLLAGQSNNVGSGNGVYLPPVAPGAFPTWKHTELDKSGVWRENVETSATPMSSVAGAQYTPWQTGTPSGSYLGQLATTLMANHSVPIAVVPCAVGSTSLAGWGVPTPYNNTSYLYGALATRANQVGDHRAVIWWQGEAEAGTSQTQAAHEAGLNALVNDWAGRYSRKWFLINLCATGNGSNLATIRAAIANVAATNANVCGVADMNVPSPAFTTTIHYGATTTEIETVAARVYSGMVSYGLYGEITGTMAVADAGAESFVFSGTVGWAGINGVMTVADAGSETVQMLGGLKHVDITLTTDGATPAANLSGITWAIFDAMSAAPVAFGSNGSTDAAGKFRVGIPGTSKSIGQDVWLAYTNSDGTSAQNPPAKAFFGPVPVSN